MKKLFERKEMKYKLTRQQAQDFVDLLAGWLVPDQYPDYEICSVYFDSANWELFRKSTDKPTYKEKLRLRSYGVPHSQSDPVFLEIKKKFDGVVYKRRIDLSLEEVEGFLRSPHGSSVSAKEIGHLIERENLQPALYVAYHRQAWTWIDDPELRITIDDSIRWRTNQLKLEDGDFGEALFEENTRILEIKSTQNFPILLVRTLKTLGIQPVSVSKAGVAYTKLIERGLYYGAA